MLNSLIAKMKGFIVTPVEMFRQSRADELRTVLAYFIPLLLFDAIMTAIVALLESIFFPRVVPGYFGPSFR